VKLSSKLSLLAVLAATFLSFSEAAMAQNATGTLTVTASVPKSCRFTSGNDTKTMAFGTVDPFATGPVDAAATFQAQCSIGTTVKAGLNSGLNVSSGVRRMKGVTTATDFLVYSLFNDAGRTVAWPVATSCADTANLVTPSGVTNPLTNSSGFDLPVWGRVLNAAATNVSAQDYSDTVTVYLCAQ
jgi:spore coat protein U-like protein